MSFNKLPEFIKEFKRLSKKYKSLSADLEEFKKVIAVIPLGNGKHFNIIAKNGNISIIKARFFCRYLKGSSLRIIYAFCSDDLNVRFDFIEIYFKGDKENEDKERIKKFRIRIGRL